MYSNKVLLKQLIYDSVLLEIKQQKYITYKSCGEYFVSGNNSGMFVRSILFYLQNVAW